MRSPATAADRLLVVHPDAACCAKMADLANGLGYEVRQARSCPEALDALRDGPEFAIVLIAWNTDPDPGRGFDADAVQFVSAVRRASATSQLVVVAPDGLESDSCRELIGSGVNGFVRLTGGPADRERLRARLAKAKQGYGQARARLRGLHQPDVFETTGFIGCSRALRDVLNRAARAAQISDVPVLISGESGTGKQLLAETIHRLDPKRSARRMISVNCAAISGSLADSALFGHMKGAFTGATEDRLGHFRAADGGTILLDEIGELDLSLQPKLLRVLQEGLVLPVGADEERSVDVRVVAATNHRLEALVEDGRFRLDLFQRLDVISIEIPPLRDRPEDIPALVRFFLKRYAAYYRTPITGVDDGVYEFLSGWRLDGNARELENLVRRMLAFKTRGDRITTEDLTAILRQNVDRAPRSVEALAREVVESACNTIGNHQARFTELIDECERLLLARAIEQSNRTQTDLAKDLGLSRRTLYNKRRKHRL